MNADLDYVLSEVVRAQREANYMESTIGQTHVAIRAMKSLARERGQTTYTKKFGADFAAMTTSPKTGKFSMRRKRLYGRLVNLCDSLIDTGSVDLSVKKRAPKRELVSERLQATYDQWVDEVAERGLAQSTRDYYSRLAFEYLRHLERAGVSSLDAAEASTIPSFLTAMRNSAWSGTSLYHLVSNFRPFVKYLQRQDLLDALALVNAKREHKIIDVLEESVQEAISEACCGGAVSRRDAAITLLAMTSGIRACDIKGMLIEDIDWIGGVITTTQDKTENPLTVPLLPAVGNAICDYLLEERPKSEDRHVFLREIAPYTCLADHATVYNIIKRVQKEAGVQGAPCGSRALRHNAASKMLRAGAHLPTIAAVLGHADPESTDVYITTDAEGMRSCVLPLPGRRDDER